MEANILVQIKNEATFYNNIVVGYFLPTSLWETIPHFFKTWLRNYVALILLYFISGFLWCFYLYYLKHNVYIPKGIRTITKYILHCTNIYFVTFKYVMYVVRTHFLTPYIYVYVTDAMPSVKTMKSHIVVSMKGLPLVTAVPTISEHLAENGWSKCFSRVDQVGWFGYFVCVIAYSVIVEFLIYWVHRKCHEIKLFYKYIHAPHHIYNKRHQLSPFAGMYLTSLLYNQSCITFVASTVSLLTDLDPVWFCL